MLIYNFLVKVAIDISPTLSAHNVRGTGSYTENLQKELQNQNYGIDFEFFKNPKYPPTADIIHYPYFDFFYHTLPINKENKRIVTIHDVIPLVFPDHFPRGLKGNLNLFLQKIALKNVDAVVCDSKTSKKDIIDKLNYPEKKIHVVYLAPDSSFKKILDSKKMSNVIEKYNLPEKFALYVGDVNWNKNIKNLLEAVKIAKVSLVMVGQALADESISQSREIISQIRKLGIGSKILRIGFIKKPDLVAIYNLAQVTVLPSHYEGFGLPVLESMACGTPVICSKVASLSEIGGAAFFCDPNNANDIADKIKNSTELNTQKRAKLSQQLMRHAKKFSWQKVASETVSVYESLN